MKVLVVGSSHGIGKKLSKELLDSNNEVFQISRTNGFDIEEDFEKICTLASDCDLVFNNVCYKDFQEKLLYRLYKTVPLMIVSGGAIRHFPKIKPDLASVKNRLYDLSKKVASASSDKKFCKILYLDFTFNEATNAQNRITNNFTTPLDSIVQLIITWIQSPVFWYVDFNLNLDSKLYSSIEKVDKGLDDLWKEINLLDSTSGNYQDDQETS
jgi:hypothetical protein